MPPSVLAPIERALARTRAVLFAPFDLTKWLTLGFCAFLAQLGESSGGVGGRGNVGSWSESGGQRELERAADWFREHWPLAVTVGALVAVLVLAVWALVLWLQSRGRFMFLDGVVRNRGAVVEPWKTYRREGNSLFGFKVWFTVLGLAAVAIAAALGVLIAWPDITAERFGPAAWGGILVGGGLLLAFVVALALIDLFLKDFVVPAMYARRVGVMAGWGVVRRELLGAYPGQVVLYVLAKIVIAVVVSILVFALVCLTLCIAACFLIIPYVGTVLLLPLIVFDRCYSLYFLDQLGGDWRLIASAEAATEPAP